MGESGLGLVASQTVPAGSVVVTVPSTVALSVEIPGRGPDDSSVLDLCTDRRAFRDLPWYAQFSLYLYKLDNIKNTKHQGANNNKNNNKDDTTINLQAWLDSLPRSFDTPIHWSKSNKDAMQYKHMTDSVDRQEVEWKELFDKTKACTTNDDAVAVPSMTWVDFLWGCECARSRAFSGAYTGSAFKPAVYIFTLVLVTAYVGLNLGTLEQAANGAGLVFCASILRDFVLPKLFKTKKYVICPAIDMCNHRSSSSSAGGGGTSAQVAFEFFADAYSLTADVDVKQGEEIFISYGTRSNDQLLQYFGFVEPDNPHDVYVMPPLRAWDIAALEQVCGGGPFAPGRLEKLDRAGLLGRDTPAKLDGTDDGDSSVGAGAVSAGNLLGGVVLTQAVGIDQAIIQALRALVSTDEEWEAAGEAVGNFAEEVNPENERKARLAARTAIEMELAAKPTTLDQDLELLKRMGSAKSTDLEEKLALQFRIEKKKLLRAAIDRLR
jgi:hypothetical protein